MTLTLAAGTRLGPYEVLAPLGAGGMGEVYRARDTRLGRDVAIKVLPRHLSDNPDVRSRFEREAKTISSLNHPNICTLFDVGREGEIDYLVMELVDGETLAHRLARGALPQSDVVKFGAQIAEALETAHKAGVVHRDLKPGNVMLTKSGLKLMDFGLARATGLAGPAGASGGSMAALTASPTISQPLTAEGTIVGTFQYLSPEQLEGREADARSDLWALGCVLYEMATRKRVFEGTTQASLISAIMRDTPRPLGELAPLSPPTFERLVNALLAKDPDDRIETAHDVRLQLQWLTDAASGFGARSGTVVSAPPRVGRPSSAAIAWGVAALAVVLAGSAWLLPRGNGPGGTPERVRLTLQPPRNAQFQGLSNSTAISPDGRVLALVVSDTTGTTRLCLRELGNLTARVLEKTVHAEQPFWSPDGRSLGYFSDGKLLTIDVVGGFPEALCDAPDPRGGTWGSRGTIVFAPIATGPLFSIPAEGGPVTEVVRPDSTRRETALRFPEFLPDGRRFTFIALPQREGELEVHLGQVGSPDRRFLMRSTSAPVFAEPGFLIATQGSRLVAQPFDARAGKLSGKPVTLGEAPFIFGHAGARGASASRTGVLVYLSGGLSETRFEWLDRTGRVMGRVAVPAGRWESVRISPDGRRAAVTRRPTPDLSELWIVELEGGRSRRLSVSTSPQASGPVWSPDGRQVAFADHPNGVGDIFVQSVDGGEPEPILTSEIQFKNAYDWSPDGKYLVFEQPDSRTGWGVWVLPMTGDRTPRRYSDLRGDQGGGWFSPDGRWLVYYSDESGQSELYVDSFPEPTGRTLLTTTSGGGTISDTWCWWTPDCREVLYLAGAQLRALNVEPGTPFRTGPSRVLCTMPEGYGSMDLTPDRQRILVTVPADDDSPPAIVIDMNWPTK